ncbi:MAG TPA: hypothetical protein VK172_10325 [Lentimicrobium sp.]|nr:hypothetical protein [Lentimicrobium sp.]
METKKSKAKGFMFLFLAIMGILSINLPAIYMFTFSKAQTIDFLTKIVENRFWTLMIPLSITIFFWTWYALKKMYESF